MRALQREAPAPNEPSERPCLFEEDEADFLVGLFDRRLLALKWVVSDSKEAGAARLQEAVQAAKRSGGAMTRINWLPLPSSGSLRPRTSRRHRPLPLDKPTAEA
ncbi:hypothetical protein A7E75_00810 [Syntrophotalea acetylenica]|uniref:Uncharacterized protein n=1 Tax=Syntrophotalea acetylenica TaxID=29542 RepID=A0A1L3GD11_SYNAC|nr:hypothetical protein A7E75_00810 [Syntrophotalea acetylenica]APG44302.1 hypothetical protein A6070_09420 [Syntrophotalea acetylenica]